MKASDEGVIFKESNVRNHPSLENILQERCSYEWLDLIITGFFLGDFVDAENEKGSISSPRFNLFSGASESEHGTYSFENTTIQIEQSDESELQNLNGEKPIGSINYYDAENVGVTIKINEKLYSNLCYLLTNNIENVSLKIAIPVWGNAEAKCLPLLKYKLTYEE